MKRSLLLAALLLASCASFSDRTQQLTLGMSPDQVRDKLGNNYVVKGSKYGSDGKPVMIWDYRDPDNKDAHTMVYFKSDHLVQWGDANSLKEVPEYPDQNKGEQQQQQQ